MRPIYLDHHATTPLDPRVLEAMLPYFTDRFGNAASKSHVYGWEAADAVEAARESLASAIGASPKEIVFTSGATEADNLALKGVAAAASERLGGLAGCHIVTVVTEHKAVLDTAASLERQGVRVTRLAVDGEGLVTVAQVAEALRPDTVLVSVMHANNEIGVVQPIRAIAALCRARGVTYHTDAAQSFGRLPLHLHDDALDLVSLSAHKLYGPKGVGALVVRRAPDVRLLAEMDGGGHERGYRSGTLPVPLIVGFARAAELMLAEREAEAQRQATLRDRLLAGLLARVPQVRVNGSLSHRLPNNLNVSFACVEGEALLMGLDGLAVSSGSACLSQSLEPSYVLDAIGVPRALSFSALRFGLGRGTTDADIDLALERTVATVERLRALSPLWSMMQAGASPDSVTWTAAGSSERVAD